MVKHGRLFAACLSIDSVQQVRRTYNDYQLNSVTAKSRSAVFIGKFKLFLDCSVCRPIECAGISERV